MHFVKAAAGAAALLGVASLPTSGFAIPIMVIDNFEVEQTIDTITSGVFAPFASSEGSVTGTAAQILGLERDARLTQFTGNGGSTESAIAEFGPDGSGEGRLNYINGFNTISVLELQWDGQDSDVLDLDRTGLGGVDLTIGNNANSILIRVLNSDAGGFIVFNIYSGEDAVSTARLDFTNTTNQDLFLEFKDFNPGGSNIVFNGSTVEESFFTSSNSANFENVTAIQAFLSGAAAIDFGVSLIGSTNIPEPMTLSLVGMGLIALGTLGRLRWRTGRKSLGPVLTGLVETAPRQREGTIQAKTSPSTAYPPSPNKASTPAVGKHS